MAYFAYIAAGTQILIFSMDPGSGKLTRTEAVTVSGGLGPLATDPEQKRMYAGVRSTCEIASFNIDRASGGLSPIGSASLDADPCYMATDRAGKFLLSAYYRAGKATVHAIGADGAVGDLVSEAQTAEHAHCVQTDASNRFAFVPHTVPANAIFQFKFDANTGALAPNAPPKVVPDGPEGPRHFVFHPGGALVYSSNENGSSITAYRFDTSAGTISAFQTLSTLPEGFDGGKNTCAQIHMHPSGKFVYVSNRGHDSIACFGIEEGSGKLRSLGQQKTEPVPRTFNLDPTGNFLFAGGQGSGKVEGFRVNPQRGTLQSLGVYDVGDRPAWVMILDL